MVNVLAHDLKLCLAQWPASGKRHEPGVLREQLGQLFQRYPGLRLLTMDALYAERDLCQAIVSQGRDYLVRIKGNQPEALAALADGFAAEELGEPQAETLGKKRGRSIGGGSGPITHWPTTSGRSRDFPGRGRARWWRRRAWI